MALTNVPLPGQSLVATRDTIAGNFTSINNTFAVDHVVYNVTGGGKHNKVTMPSQGTPPAFSAGEMGLFNQTAAPYNRPDVWLARGVATAYPMTGYVNNGAGASNGFTWLPSGIKMIWGTSTISAGGQVTVTYATAVPTFPGFTTFWMQPMVTRIRPVGAADNFVMISAYNATTFTAFSSGLQNGINFGWFALGL